MFIPDGEKDGRKNALKKLMDMMGSGAADGLEKFKGGRGGPSGEDGSEMDDPDAIAVEVDMDAPSDDDAQEMGGGGLSDEDKMMIEKLYHKFCM